MTEGGPRRQRTWRGILKVSDNVAADVFSALGDRTRLSLVRRLGEQGAQSATKLADGSSVTRQAIVKHLRVLERARLVTHEPKGREVLYSLDTERFAEAGMFLDGISAGWDRALKRLKDIVECSSDRP